MDSSHADWLGLFNIENEPGLAYVATRYLEPDEEECPDCSTSHDADDDVCPVDADKDVNISE